MQLLRSSWCLGARYSFRALHFRQRSRSLIQRRKAGTQERNDPGNMDITRLQVLYEHLTGRVATGACGKDESGLRLKIAEAHRKHLLFCCYPNFTDECVDVALKSKGGKGVEIKEDGVTIALATVVKNRLLCICVRDDFQKHRYGTFLLSKCCTLIRGDEMIVEAD